MGLTKAAFLDRDGTLVADVGYARSPDDLTLLPGVREALEKLRARGFALVVVTNQSGIGRGYFREADYALQVKRLNELLGAAAAPDAHYYCPHHPTEALAEYLIDCNCRKPKPGLFLRAIADLGLDPSRSMSIGDSPRDAEAALAAGVRARVTLVSRDPVKEKNVKGDSSAFENAVDAALSQLGEG